MYKVKCNLQYQESLIWCYILEESLDRSDWLSHMASSNLENIGKVAIGRVYSTATFGLDILFS